MHCCMLHCCMKLISTMEIQANVRERFLLLLFLLLLDWLGIGRDEGGSDKSYQLPSLAHLLVGRPSAPLPLQRISSSCSRHTSPGITYNHLYRYRRSIQTLDSCLSDLPLLLFENTVCIHETATLNAFLESSARTPIAILPSEHTTFDNQ
jgi:hypothetical protein